MWLFSLAGNGLGGGGRGKISSCPRCQKMKLRNWLFVLYLTLKPMQYQMASHFLDQYSCQDPYIQGCHFTDILPFIYILYKICDFHTFSSTIPQYLPFFSIVHYLKIYIKHSGHFSADPQISSFLVALKNQCNISGKRKK